MKLTDLQKASIGKLVASALSKDIGNGDATATKIDADKVVGATIVARGSLVLSGQFWVDEVYAQIDDTVIVDWYVGDKQTAETDDVICKLVGPARALKAGERIALNFLQTLSSTASSTSKSVTTVDFEMISQIDQVAPTQRHA